MATLSANLPAWLHNYIYGTVGACENADWEKARLNLLNTHEENIDYLGTYFPRTFTEVCRIIATMEQKTQYFDAVSSKNCFHILSAGCGTGGDICGLIHAIHTLKPQSSFEVNLFDGNADALQFCCNVLHELSVQENIRVSVRTKIVHIVQSSRDFEELSELFSEQDIIITSKFLNEVLGYFSNAYYYFVKKFSKLLSSDGIMILNDVVSRAYSGSYVPKYMNRNLNTAVREKELSSVLPLPCKANRNCTNISCYSRFCNRPYRDYTFRVISSIQFANEIVPTVQPKEYEIDYTSGITCKVVA
ncbi:MAG: hypothetical protein SPL03_08395 [Succinivibrio dextrinosolvens]|nr:hypothetical protein [Succinivibrio dextrinosolvens]